jgi:uncharacterized protein
MARPTIAIVGASANRGKFGNKCVRAYSAAGYEVYPVNPRTPRIEGLKAYTSLADVPAAELDMISVYLQPSVCLQFLPELARKPAREVWFNPGAYDTATLEKARAFGINVIAGCSILHIGANPHEL